MTYLFVLMVSQMEYTIELLYVLQSLGIGLFCVAMILTIYTIMLSFFFRVCFLFNFV